MSTRRACRWAIGQIRREHASVNGVRRQPGTRWRTSTTWFARLRRVLAELRGEQARLVSEEPWATWDQWLRGAGPDRVVKTVERCQHQLQTGTHDQVCEALQTLGRIVGVAAERPAGQSAADAAWTWASRRRIDRRLWEVKTGAPDAVPRDWVNQALGQLAAERPSDDVVLGGVVLVDLEAVEADAAAAARHTLALPHRDAVLAVALTWGKHLQAYAAGWNDGTAEDRGAARDAVEPLLPNPGWLARLTQPSGGRLLRAADADTLLLPAR